MRFQFQGQFVTIRLNHPTNWVDLHTMSCWKAFAKLAEQEGTAEDRSNPRFRARNLNCECGTIEDFSSSGLRIRYRRNPKLQSGEIVQLEILSPAGQHNCEAEVVWVSKTGFRTFQAGFAFTDPNACRKMGLFNVGYDPLSEGEWSSR